MKSKIGHLLGQERIRVGVLALLILIIGIILVALLAGSSTNKMADTFGLDFRSYWSVSRVLVSQGNPYDRAQLLNMEQSSGYTGIMPIMVWYPPWAFTIFLPFSFLPFPISTLLWLAINVFLALTCGAVLWRELAPLDDRRFWLGMILAFVYMPTLQTLRIGQISLWLLAGITGFLAAVRTRRDGLAGAFLVLLTIKPHVSFLFLFAAVWWVVRERRWRVIQGWAITFGCACVIVGLFSPEIFAQYLRPTAGSPLYWSTATLGSWLLAVFGAEHYWLQYLPSAIGLLLFVIWAKHHNSPWNWPQLAPGLLLASSIFAAYGWPYDQVVLLAVIVVIISKFHLLSSLKRFILISLYVLTQLGMLLLNQYGIAATYYYWYPLVLAGLYAWQQVKSNRIPSGHVT